MLSSVRTFLDDPRLREEPPELFVLSYAGHRIQGEGEVYLVPTDAKLEVEAEDCAIECLSLGRLLQLLRDKLDVPVRQKMGEDRAIVFLGVLDSCRTHSRGHGALAFEPAPGSAPLKYTLYFWCSRTTTASDGPSGGYSPFAEALLDEQHRFFAEGVTLQDAIANVPRAVEKKGQQKPVEYAITTIPRHFCIRPSAGGAHAGPAGGTADGGSAGAGGGHKRKRQVDADVLALLREWELEDESERLAENGVWTRKALEIMTELDRKEFRCSLELRELLQHVAEQKEKKRPSDGSNEHKADAETKVVAGAAAEAKVKANLPTVPSPATFDCQSTLTGHTGPVMSVCFDHTGKKLASGGGSFDNSVRLWSTESGAPIGSPLSGHSPDGKQVASGSTDKTVKIWQTSTGQSIH